MPSSLLSAKKGLDNRCVLAVAVLQGVWNLTYGSHLSSLFVARKMALHLRFANSGNLKRDRCSNRATTEESHPVHCTTQLILLTKLDHFENLADS